MPKDKKPEQRYRRIHEIFTRRSGAKSVVKLQDLADELDISLRRLSDDLQYMREKGAPLEYVAALRGWRYKPGHDFMVLEDQLLSTEDIAGLRIAFELLQRIDHYHLAPGHLPKIFRKIYEASRKWMQPGQAKKHIYFDPLPKYQGSKHLPFFLEAIEQNRRVEFQYRPFHNDTAKAVVFDPWFLRHYDRRWYVGGFSHDPAELFVRVFPLERLDGAPQNIGYCHDRPPDYDAATYWRYIYGITVPPAAQVEEIVLEFKPIQGKYFLSSPFVEPFEIVESNTERLVVALRLIPNIDLLRKLASYGADLRVLQPQSLVAELQRFFNDALNRYQGPPV